MSRLESIKNEYKTDKKKKSKEVIQMYVGRLGTFKEKEDFLKKAK